ncbi:MAG: 4Fe-4S binding protein [Blautia sp.]
MSRLIIDGNRCKSCGYCIAACPREALSFCRQEGRLYDTVSVDEERCIGCGSCYRVCPDYVFEIVEDEGGARA